MKGALVRERYAMSVVGTCEKRRVEIQPRRFDVICSDKNVRDELFSAFFQLAFQCANVFK